MSETKEQLRKDSVIVETLGIHIAYKAAERPTEDFVYYKLRNTMWQLYELSDALDHEAYSLGRHRDE